MPSHDDRSTVPTPRPLDGVLVVALGQAVAAPYCSSRLADAGARVIKIERREGDFARGYDHAVHGESSYWVWINRGKESIALDVKEQGDMALLERLLASADVFIQNLASGATERLGIGSAALRERHPRLVTFDISGCGDTGSHIDRPFGLLVQAESGLVSVSGAPGEWGRIGVSLCDINAGLNALIGVQQALMQRPSPRRLRHEARRVRARTLCVAITAAAGPVRWLRVGPSVSTPSSTMPTAAHGIGAMKPCYKTPPH